MKKVFSLILITIIIFTFCSCKKGQLPSDNSLSSTVISDTVSSEDDTVPSSPSSVTDDSASSPVPESSETPVTDESSEAPKPSAPSSAPSTPAPPTNNVPIIPGTVYILGDSYSTFEGCIPPGYVTWYKEGGNGNTDVVSKEQTWWHLLTVNNNLTVMTNDSYSGTTICNTGYNGVYSPSNSFIGRIDTKIKFNAFKSGHPEKFIIFGGTNDSWADSPVGYPKWGSYSQHDLKFVIPAFCYLITCLTEALPNTEIITVINSELKPEITSGLSDVCKEKNIKCVQLTNISKQAGHPDQLGMQQIYEQIDAVITKN